MIPKVMILTDAGTNCESETSKGFSLAGAKPYIIHLNDVIAGEYKLEDFDILAIPGGFSFGDHIKSGKALANKIESHLWDDLLDFVELDLYSCFFSIGDVILKQDIGIPMGSPMSPPLAVILCTMQDRNYGRYSLAGHRTKVADSKIAITGRRKAQ